VLALPQPTLTDTKHLWQFFYNAIPQAFVDIPFAHAMLPVTYNNFISDIKNLIGNKKAGLHRLF
jgi:hypothetical protein